MLHFILSGTQTYTPIKRCTVFFYPLHTYPKNLSYQSHWKGALDPEHKASANCPLSFCALSQTVIWGTAVAVSEDSFTVNLHRRVLYTQVTQTEQTRNWRGLLHHKSNLGNVQGRIGPFPPQKHQCSEGCLVTIMKRAKKIKSWTRGNVTGEYKTRMMQDLSVCVSLWKLENTLQGTSQVREPTARYQSSVKRKAKEQSYCKQLSKAVVSQLRSWRVQALYTASSPWHLQFKESQGCFQIPRMWSSKLPEFYFQSRTVASGIFQRFARVYFAS